MKKTLCVLLCFSSLVSAKSLVDYIKEDISSFVNPRISDFDSMDIFLDGLFIGAGYHVSDTFVKGDSFHNHCIKLLGAIPFMAVNEYFRSKYAKKVSYSKNIFYLAILGALGYRN